MHYNTSSVVDTCGTLLKQNGNYVNSTTVLIGDSIVFQCMCQNTIQWKHNGNDITTNTRYIINATSGTLTIPVVKISDEGNYTCNCSSVSLTVTSKLLLYLCGECDSCEINNNCVYTHYTYFS